MLRKRGLASDIVFRQSERFNLDGEANDFDVVIILRFYTSLIHSRAARIQFLSACRERLREDGVIAFDYFIRPKSRFPPDLSYLRCSRGFRIFCVFSAGEKTLVSKREIILTLKFHFCITIIIQLI
jgi:hypothetical protein